MKPMATPYVMSRRRSFREILLRQGRKISAMMTAETNNLMAAAPCASNSANRIFASAAPAGKLAMEMSSTERAGRCKLSADFFAVMAKALPCFSTYAQRRRKIYYRKFFLNCFIATLQARAQSKLHSYGLDSRLAK